MSEYAKPDYWLDSAEYDSQTAKAMLETKRYLYLGFSCHQTIEKALKGVFVAAHPDEDLPHIHRLVRLANLSGITDELSDEQLALLDTLNPVNIEARHSLHKELLLKSLTPEKYTELIRETDAMVEWLKTKL